MQNLEPIKERQVFSHSKLNCSVGKSISPVTSQEVKRAQGCEYPTGQLSFLNKVHQALFSPQGKFYLVVYLVFCFIILSYILMSPQPVKRKGYTVEQLADAIYLAEGGAKTNHPYGILAHYKTTTPRQACINTINHALRDWNGQGDFIDFLGNRYCPVGADNDPTGLNKNWVKNVKALLRRNTKRTSDE